MHVNRGQRSCQTSQKGPEKPLDNSITPSLTLCFTVTGTFGMFSQAPCWMRTLVRVSLIWQPWLSDPRGWEGMCQGLSSGLLTHLHRSPAEADVGQRKPPKCCAGSSPVFCWIILLCVLVFFSLLSGFSVLAQLVPYELPFLKSHVFCFCLFVFECLAVTLVLHLRHPALAFPHGRLVRPRTPSSHQELGMSAPFSGCALSFEFTQLFPPKMYHFTDISPKHLLLDSFS